MVNPYITVFVFITVIASFSQVYAEPIIFDSDYMVEKFATGLDYPTTMYFVGEDILVLEKNTGKVIRIQDSGVLYNEPALDVPVSYQSESGLLGIASVSNHVFLYFTEALSGVDTFSIENSKNAVYQYDWNGEKLTNPILIKEFPALIDHHHSGIMTKGLNNEVYFAIGDQGQYTASQNIPINPTQNHEIGSIFKINTENNNNIELIAMGIRNSFGLAVDPVTGYLWETENGVDRFDEINLVKPGFNSGWRGIMGPADLCAEYSTDCYTGRSDIIEVYTLNPTPFENFEYSDPEFSWYDTVAPTAIAFPDNSFGKYSDSLFVGDFNNGRIYNFQLNSDRTGFDFSNPDLSDLVLDDNDEIDEIIFASYFQGVIDIKFRDGAMYVVSFGDGSIYKIYQKEHISPLKQSQSGVTNKNIVCKPSLMPIMNKSGYIYCVQPKTAITLNNVLNWSINHPEMPKIELKHQDLSGLNFEYVNLSNSDFAWSNLGNTKISNVNFTQANLSHTDLSGKDLTGTILTGADLSGAKLVGVDISGKDLTGTILAGADLSGKDLTGTILTGADLSDAILTGADLTGKDLTGTILINANLENASLENAKFLDANLFRANLANADLTNILLVDSNLENATLTGADLTNVILTDAIFTGVDLSGVDLSGTIHTGYDLSGKDLTGTILTGYDLSGKDLTGTILAGVDLSGANLSNAILINANLENATLDAKFLDANLFRANLANADLRNAILVDANLENATLTGADLTNAVLTGATLTGADLTNAVLNCVGHPVCV